jgi:asparagine synthase (glutamine-hydrolysing)
MQESARETVPWGPSIACSTPAAIEWVAQWKASNDPSGRLIASHNSATPVHDDGAHANGNGNGNGAVANGNNGAVANGNGHVNGTANGNGAVANGNGHVNGAANGKANGALE